MERLTTRQMIGWIVALLVGGALTAWGTVSAARYLLAVSTDPKQDGLSPVQAVDKKKQGRNIYGPRTTLPIPFVAFGIRGRARVHAVTLR